MLDASAAIRIKNYDLGGRTKRYVTCTVSGDRHVTLSKLTTEKKFAVYSTRDLFSSMARDIMIEGMEGINTVVISIAGPLSKTERGVVARFPNQPIADQENHDVPVGREVAAILRRELGRPINVLVVNDGDVGTAAEFSPGGVLGDLKDGEYGSCVIVGNGVGGRLYMKQGNVLMPALGHFEFGHWRVGHNIIDALGLPDFEGVPCGCTLTGNRAAGKDVCGEMLTKGPALETFFRLGTGMYDLTNEMASAYLRGEEELEAIKLGQLRHVLDGEARLLGDRFAALQTHYEVPIHYALIAGIGRNFGELMLPKINEAISNHQRSSWVLSPDIRVGKFKSDECNSVGAALMGAELETSGQKIEYAAV